MKYESQLEIAQNTQVRWCISRWPLHSKDAVSDQLSVTRTQDKRTRNYMLTLLHCLLTESKTDV